MLPSVKRSEIICVNNLEKMSARRTSNNGRNCIDVSPYGSRRGSKDKPTDQHASRDGTRSFTYSAKHAPVYPLLWPKTEYSRLQTKAKLKTLDDKLNEFKLNELEKKNLLEASDKRKKHLQEIDRERQSNSGVLGNVFNEIVEHDKDLTSRKIIDRAFVAKQEQEEEVKRANRIILAAKCHIIRDAQIAEKQEIERELRAEELRLERIMLDENEKALKEEEQKAYLDKQRITQHSEEIRNQLLEKEKMKLKEAERIEEEARVLKHAQLAIVAEEQRKEKEKIDKINAIRDDLKKAYELSAYYKQLEFEEQRIAELKVQEYTRQRNERQAKLEFEKKIATDVKEREQERMLKIQQKLMDTKSAKTDMDLRRGQEHVEREFRKREKDAVIKKRELEKQIANARAAQLEAVKTERAMQIARDEMDHRKAVEQLKHEEQKETDNVHKLLQLREKYREEIIRQINQKEQERREKERCLKKEHSMMQDLTKKREMNIKSTIANKIKIMKESKVPERFIKDVERQLESIRTE
ncbi:cilia- and flagella-associated protein 45 isoform X1 [Toxorhynchites rutilus septentrionalis]|uniref:cilia- and flagella-associated protein 45 isoform X1 n=1 Tax=Toxorhynchites rutilus septentrionalis TaxID=329112 RepID=UPI0024799EF3|nr:cilia- and flagella-associated protein 45 isoform X1 [Toxorhynchites rutilus septentrionalis]